MSSDSGSLQREWIFVMEIVVLVVLLLVWRSGLPQLSTGMSLGIVALAALSMGMQSAAVLRLHAGPSTTYITGTLTRFTMDVIRWPHLVRAATTDSARPEHSAWIYGATWLVYLGGATATGLLYLAFGAMAVLLPIASLIVAAIVELRRPSSHRR